MKNSGQRKLSTLELAIAKHLQEGKSANEIATSLQMGLKELNNKRQEIYSKVGVKSYTEFLRTKID